LKKNIFFLVIDSLRADKFFGSKKSSITPNIDLMIKNGTYFTQNITSAPNTIPSMASIFTGLYPFECVKKENDFSLVNTEINNYVKNIENKGYKCHATLPKIISYLGFEKVFQNSLETYERTDTLYNGLGKKIINNLKSFTKNEPWFYYLHLYDLVWISSNANFNPDDGPNQMKDEKFGKNQYERILSVIDIWLGKMWDCLDKENTLMIITGDHGSDLGEYDSKMEEDNKKYQDIRRSKSVSDNKIANKVINKFFKKKSDEIENKIEKMVEDVDRLKISSYKKRLLKYSIVPKQNLYDEKFRVPLLFYGEKIPSGIIISQQVRSIDIFPTIIDVIKMDELQKNTRGRSLLPIMEGKNLDELPVYMESVTNSSKSWTDNTIGIRTSKFKYFRDKDDSTKNIHLYDLKNDELEENNILNNEKLKMEMENILKDILNNNMFEKEDSKELMEEETQIIESELRKLGYID
jgi:arylsulfatase A-like enzyme